MANTFKKMYRGSAPTTSTTLYTVPSDTTTLLNNILVVNTTASAQTYSLSVESVSMAASVSVPANDTAVLDIKQVLTASATVAGFASASTVNFHISGLEISP
jgi:hypothetical protein